MAIRLDESATSVVVYCTDCGHWRAFTWTREEAHESAVRHEQNVHPKSMRAWRAQRRFLERRHADDSPNVVGAVAASEAWESSSVLG